MLLEGCVGSIAMTLAWFSEFGQKELLSIAIFLAFLFLFHLPLAVKKGASYVIWSELGGSGLKYYWFFSIFLAAMFSASSVHTLLAYMP